MIPYVHRTNLENEIVAAAQARKRLLLGGHVGSGRSTLLRNALEGAGYAVFVVDLLGAILPVDLDAAFRQLGEGDTMSAALHRLDSKAASTPTALVISNIDGCLGMVSEDNIMGSLRGHLQRVQELAVFYTAASNDFVGRHVANDGGAFFKQCVVAEVGFMDLSAVSEMLQARIGSPTPTGVRSLIADSVGLLPGNLAPFIERLAEQRERDGILRETPITIAEVNDLLCRIVIERKAQYEAWCQSFMTGRQLSLLSAFARGVPLRASNEMESATGIPVNSAWAVIRAVERSGFLVASGKGHVFADPYFRLHLMARVV